MVRFVGTGPGVRTDRGLDGGGGRVRSGSLSILAGWSCFVLAGALFAKFTEHWDAVPLPAGHLLAGTGYSAVQWAGVVGTVLVVTAALMVLPAFIRLIRGGGWKGVRRPVLRALTLGSTTLVCAVACGVWSHHLSYHDRNGGLVPYELAVLFLALAVVVSIAAGTVAIIAVAWRLDLSGRAERHLAGVAISVSFMMVIITVGTVLWWSVEALHAPDFFREGIGNGLVFTSARVPPVLVIAGILMTCGLTAAALGSLRAVRSLRAISPGSPASAQDDLAGER